MIKKLIASLSLVVLIALAAPSTTLAWSPFGDACSGAGSASAVCKDKGQTTNPLTGTNGLLMKIIDIIALVAGVAAVIIIILSGIRFITSGGSSDDISGARRSIIYACVGLVVIVLGRALIEFVLSKLS